MVFFMTESPETTQISGVGDQPGTPGSWTGFVRVESQVSHHQATVCTMHQLADPCI